MFFFFNLDDYFEGVTSTIGLGIKLILSFLFIGLPIAFFERGGLGVIIALIFGCCLSVFLLSLFCIINSVKLLLNKNVPQEFSYKKRKFAIIYLILYLVISLISLLIPSNIVIFRTSLVFSKVIYVLVNPLILNVIYIFCIYGDFAYKKHVIKYGILIPLKKLLSSLFIPTFIFYWLVLLFYLGANGTPKIHDFYNSMLDKTTNFVEYKNMKFDEIRNDENVEKIIESRIDLVSKNKLFDSKELEIENGKFPDLF